MPTPEPAALVRTSRAQGSSTRNLPPVTRSVRITTVYREPSPTPHPLPPPQRIAAFLRVVRILLGYGRHLVDTVSRRAAAPGFAAIAACFGTANLATSRPPESRHPARRRAGACPARPRRTRPRHRTRRPPHPRGQPPPAPADAASQQTAPPTPRHVAPAPSLSLGPDHPANLHAPTLEQLEPRCAAVRGSHHRRYLPRSRRRPRLLHRPFWNELFDLAHCHGGSIARLMQERCRREQAFSHEQDTYPTPVGTGPTRGGRRSARCWASSSASPRSRHSPCRLRPQRPPARPELGASINPCLRRTVQRNPAADAAGVSADALPRRRRRDPHRAPRARCAVRAPRDPHSNTADRLEPVLAPYADRLEPAHAAAA